MYEQFTNNAESTLDGDINDSVTSLDVADASSFPSSGNFRIRINDELMLVTAVSSETFTVVRGVEGTTADSHTSGDDVEHLITAGGKFDLVRVNKGGFGRSQRMGLFDGSGNVLDSSDFTWVNQSTHTATDLTGAIAVQGPGNGTANSNHILVRSAPSTPFELIAGFNVVLLGQGILANCFPAMNFGFRESATGKLRYLGFYASLAGNRINTQIASTATSGHANDAGPHLCHLPMNPLWLKIEDDGADLFFYYSPDGEIWSQVATFARTNHFTTAPDQVFFGLNSFNATTLPCEVTVVSWQE